MKFSLIILLVIAVGCTTQSRKIGPSDSFFYDEKEVAFSSTSSKDIFSITAYGNDTLNARIIFRIRKATGDVIYIDSLISSSFCGTGADPDNLHDALSTPSGRKLELFHQLNTFFKDSRFDKPAIAYNTFRDAPYDDSLVWEEFRNNPLVIGFRYNKDVALEIGIGFSKFQNKVVKYYAMP